jgi:hypothetical protein
MVTPSTVMSGVFWGCNAWDARKCYTKYPVTRQGVTTIHRYLNVFNNMNISVSSSESRPLDCVFHDVEALQAARKFYVLVWMSVGTSAAKRQFLSAS